MNGQKHVGAAVHCLERSVFKLIEVTRKKYALEDVDRTQCWILGCLYRNRDKDTYQKDLEAVLSLGKSAVTNQVKQLEKLGYIRREEVKEDARLKKLLLTEAGIQKHLNTVSMFDEVEKNIHAGIDPEKLAVFFEVADQMKRNIEKVTGEKLC